MENSPQVEVRSTREDRMAYKSVDYSGFIERVFARGVDFLIAIGAGYLSYRWTDLPKSIAIALAFDLIMRIVFTYFLGCTIGKLIFGVRVISRCGEKLSIWQVIIRELSKYISGLFLNLGYVSIIVSRRKISWHDMIACTAVTSGGREEARYGRDVYKERPEKWYVQIFAPITAVLFTALLISLNKGALYLLNDVGMVGFLSVLSSAPVEFRYKTSSPSLGLAGINKSIIQLGDTDGDRGYELFKEGIKDGKPSVRNLKLTALKPTDGDIGVSFDNGIIQYRMLDMNGDQKDEMAVLLEDRMLRVYKLDGEAAELASYGPVEYSEITSVIKGKAKDAASYSMYILGDNNKLTTVSMVGGILEGERRELPGSYKFISFDMGNFGGRDYYIGATDDGKLVFYTIEEDKFNKVKEMAMPVKGRITITVKDINADGKNELIVTVPKDESRDYHVLTAYDVSGEDMKIVWNGGRHYRFEEGKVDLAIDDGMDMDNDNRFEMYMVSKNVSDQEGRISIFIFESDKYLFKINEFLRFISLSKPQ